MAKLVDIDRERWKLGSREIAPLLIDFLRVPRSCRPEISNFAVDWTAILETTWMSPVHSFWLLSVEMSSLAIVLGVDDAQIWLMHHRLGAEGVDLKSYRLGG